MHSEIDFVSRMKNSSHFGAMAELTELELLKLHNEVLELCGGRAGVRDENLFSSVCKAPYQEWSGIQFYDTPFKKAAKYLVDFCQYQIFVDGNKRTGVFTMTEFLRNNGYKVKLQNEQMYDLTIKIANGTIKEVDEVANYLEQCSTRIYIRKKEYYYGR